MTQEAGATYRLEVGGTLTRGDLEQWQRALAAEIQKQGTVRLLVVLSRFAGWAREDRWDDMAFYQSYGDKIERLAIVGEDRWREQAMMFVGAGLRKGQVEFFVPGAISLAREWLAE
jgi:hypothetical protein